MKILKAALVLYSFFMILSCNEENHLASIKEIIVTENLRIKALEKEQATTKDVERLFAIGDEINLIKKEAQEKLQKSFSKIGKPISLPFQQTANNEKISIHSLSIVDIQYPKYIVEAKVKVLQSSNFSMPYAGLTAVTPNNTRLDVGGGVGYSEKVESGKEYTFKGEIYNPEFLTDSASIIFDEPIKKW